MCCVGLMNSLSEPYFDKDDLGLLDGPPMRGAEIVASTASDLLSVRGAAFIVFDEISGQAVIRGAARGAQPLIKSYALSSSCLTAVRSNGESLAIEVLKSSASERDALNASSVLATAVVGPDQQVVGALAAWNRYSRAWTPGDISKIGELGYLISQEIALRASFATLRIMATERGRYSH